MKFSNNLYKKYNRFQISIISFFIFEFRVNLIKILNFVNFKIHNYQNLIFIFL